MTLKERLQDRIAKAEPAKYQVGAMKDNGEGNSF